MRSEDRYDSLIRYYAEERGFEGKDWLRFKAQIKAESNFDPDARSRVGAVGLAQFMPLTWSEWHDGTPGLQKVLHELKLIDPRDPEDAIRSQIHYMKWLLGRVTTWDLAFAAYNWGIGRVLRVWQDPLWRSKLPLETENYLYRINKYYEEYANGR